MSQESNTKESPPDDETVDSTRSDDTRGWKLRLYVELGTPEGSRTAARARHLLNTRISGSFELDVVDPRVDLECTRSDDVVATPTLVRASPPPRRKVVGDLSDGDSIVQILGLF